MTGCKPEQPRASTNLSPLVSPLSTVVPLPVATAYPTKVIRVESLPTPLATPGQGIVMTVTVPSGGYTGGASTWITKEVVPGTIAPTPTFLPQVQPFGANGVLVNLRPSNEPVSVRVGQQLVIKEPATSRANEGWNITYDPTVLQLAANVNLSTPSTNGWRWTVRQTGTTTITFQTKVPPCTTPPVCPDMPFARFTLVLQISP